MLALRLGRAVCRSRLHRRCTTISWALASFFAFLFLLCGSARLARFNVQKNPIPKNPGRPRSQVFRRLADPGSRRHGGVRGLRGGFEPITYWPFAVAWMVLLGLLSFLMVSTWRYYSFKEFNLMRPRSPLIGHRGGRPDCPHLALFATCSGHVCRVLCRERHRHPHRRHHPRATCGPRPPDSRSTRLAKTESLALIGSETLLGREIRDLLSGNYLGHELRLVAAETEEAGKLTEQAGEPALVTPLAQDRSRICARRFFWRAPSSRSKKSATLPPALT